MSFSYHSSCLPSASTLPSPAPSPSASPSSLFFWRRDNRRSSDPRQQNVASPLPLLLVLL
eukprot:14703572-Heterocapsa_arctica.AAC.1